METNRIDAQGLGLFENVTPIKLSQKQKFNLVEIENSKPIKGNQMMEGRDYGKWLLKTSEIISFLAFSLKRKIQFWERSTFWNVSLFTVWDIFQMLGMAGEGEDQGRHRDGRETDWHAHGGEAPRRDENERVNERKKRSRGSKM